MFIYLSEKIQTFRIAYSEKIQTFRIAFFDKIQIFRNEPQKLSETLCTSLKK